MYVELNSDNQAAARLRSNNGTAPELREELATALISLGSAPRLRA